MILIDMGIPLDPHQTQVTLALPGKGGGAPALQKGVVVINYSDIGKNLEIRIPKALPEGAVVSLGVKGDVELGIHAKVEKSGKRATVITIPVSEITTRVEPGQTYTILIRNKEYSLPSSLLKIQVSPQELGKTRQKATTPNAYYRGVFQKMLAANTPEIQSLQVVLANNDGTPAKDDLFWSSGSGAYHLYNNELTKGAPPLWKKESEEHLSSKNAASEEATFITTVYPADYAGAIPKGAYVMTGAMKTEYESLPEGPFKQSIRASGVKVTHTIKYYEDTYLGYQEMVLAMESGNYDIVQSQGHRYTEIQGLIRNVGANRPGAAKPIFAYFGNHCNGDSSDDPALATVFPNIFIPVQTTDSVHGAAKVNHAFLTSMITGDAEPERVRAKVAITYAAGVFKNAPQARGSIFKTPREEFYNAGSDPDEDGLIRLDPEPQAHNDYTLNGRDLFINTSNGPVKVHFYAMGVATKEEFVFPDREKGPLVYAELLEKGYLKEFREKDPATGKEIRASIVQIKAAFITLKDFDIGTGVLTDLERRKLLSDLQRATNWGFYLTENPAFVSNVQKTPPGT